MHETWRLKRGCGRECGEVVMGMCEGSENKEDIWGDRHGEEKGREIWKGRGC